ncbi:hypothetical protein MRX96_000946 [Rhipicephalus microplus]
MCQKICVPRVRLEANINLGLLRMPQSIVQERCLSFYSLAKSPRGGSLSPGLLDSLLSAEEALVENEKHDDVVTMDAVEVAVDHADYVEKRSDPRLVYYIAGYVARKRILSTNCTACRDACLVPKDSVSGEVPADASKEWDLGGLLYPAVSLYHLIECLESRLTREFSRTNLHSKAALSILGKVSTNVPQIGCVDHCQELTSALPSHEKVSGTLKCILECYIKRDYLEATPLSDVQYKDPAKFLPLEGIYLGAKPTAALSGGTHGLNDDQIHNFRLRCLEFFIEAARQIYLRFPLKSHQLKNLRVLDPKVVMGKTIPSIAPLAVSFPLIVRENEVNELDREWRLLRNMDLSEHAGLTASQFWHAVSQMRKGDGSQEFPLLSAFMKNILCLPHSSAAVERVFSQVNLLKTKQRNRLSTDALCGLLHAKRTLTDSSCYTFQITPSHLKRMKK